MHFLPPTVLEKIHRVSWDRLQFSDATVTVIETADDGAGTVTFTVRAPCVGMVAAANNQHPIAWAKQRKCADGAIFQFVGNDVIAHLVELKTSLNSKKWAHAKLQFEGMLINLIALAGVLGLRIIGVKTYLAFQQDDLSVKTTSSLISLKQSVGASSPLMSGEDWRKGMIKLLDFDRVEVIKIQRDATGDAAHVLG